MIELIIQINTNKNNELKTTIILLLIKQLNLYVIYIIKVYSIGQCNKYKGNDIFPNKYDILKLKILIKTLLFINNIKNNTEEMYLTNVTLSIIVYLYVNNLFKIT